jgi:RNA polymerase sigma-19 factor, ECF subfamily
MRRRTAFGSVGARQGAEHQPVPWPERGATSEPATLAYQATSRFRAGLARFLLRRVRSAHDAEDLAQEVYLRLLRVRSTVEHPKAYIYRVAANVIYEFCLQRDRELGRLASGADDVPVEDIMDHAAGPERLLELRGVENTLSAVVAELPPMQRAVLLLAKHRGLSHAEIAARLGISVNTARVHLYRALARCRASLLARGEVP